MKSGVTDSAGHAVAGRHDTTGSCECVSTGPARADAPLRNAPDALRDRGEAHTFTQRSHIALAARSASGISYLMVSTMLTGGGAE
jgi:hypothetical protein